MQNDDNKKSYKHIKTFANLIEDNSMLMFGLLLESTTA